MTQPLLQHVAIIMDGNGRWARRRFLPRVFGHKIGADVARRIILAASNQGIGYLTLYALSSENRTRPAFEVAQLLRLLENYLQNEIDFLISHNIKAVFIGDIAAMGAQVVALTARMVQATQHCTGMTLVLAINYGARDEITRAIQQAAHNNVNNWQRYLDTAHLPDPDLIIRTGGEQRLSNFLLWQAAYAELWFTPVLWPEFTAQHLAQALQSYSTRQRRYGQVSATA